MKAQILSQIMRSSSVFRIVALLPWISLHATVPLVQVWAAWDLWEMSEQNKFCSISADFTFSVLGYFRSLERLSKHLKTLLFWFYLHRKCTWWLGTIWSFYHMSLQWWLVRTEEARVGSAAFQSYGLKTHVLSHPSGYMVYCKYVTLKASLKSYSLLERTGMF